LAGGAAFCRKHGKKRLNRIAQFWRRGGLVHRASDPRHGLRRDHPRFTLQPDPAQRGDDVIDMERGHLVPATALHAKACKQRYQHGIFRFRRGIDRAGPARLACEIELQFIGKAARGGGIEPGPAP